MSKPSSYDYNLNYFFNSENIPNQDLVFDTFDYFDSGSGKEYYDALTFLNLLLWHYDFIKNNVSTPIDILTFFKALQISEIKKQILLGFILKWYGGYPVTNMNSQFQTCLKFIERQYLLYFIEKKKNTQQLLDSFNSQKDMSEETYNDFIEKLNVRSNQMLFLEGLDKIVNTNETVESKVDKSKLVTKSPSPLKQDELFVFISHSSKDKEIVKRFIDKILKLSLKIDTDQIFCTSLEESSIKSGEDFRFAIKGNLQKSSLTILFITHNYRSSEVCLNEMGAAWVLGSKVISFIVPPVDYESVGFIHEPNQLLKLNKKEDLLKFIDEEKTHNKVKIGEIARHVDEFLLDDFFRDRIPNIQKAEKKQVSKINDIGLLEGDVVEINNRDGLYLYQNSKLKHIADDSAFSLHVYGLNRKDRKAIDYSSVVNIIDNSSYIPVLHTCKIIIDTATNKKWLSVNGERRFLPNTVYAILVRKDGYKIVSLSHDEVMRIPEGDKLFDTKGHFE